MRFEIRETVPTPDREMVLRALEMCSREISSEVVRFGDRITVHGLGPSPRTKNRNDMTVFCVNAEQDNTIIEAEVNFQASALLGETSQQDVVRSKLDDLFGQMNAQISLDTLRMARYTAARRSAATGSTAVVERPAQPLEAEQRREPVGEGDLTAPQAVLEAPDAAPEAGLAAAALVGEPEANTAAMKSEPPPKVVGLEDEVLSVHLLPPALADAPYRTFAVVETEKPVERRKSVPAEQASRPRPIPSPAVPELRWAARSKRSGPEEDPEEVNGRLSKPAMWAVALIAFLLVAGGIDYSYLSRRNAAALSAPIAAPSGNEAVTNSPAVADQEAAVGSSSAKTSNSQSATVDPTASAASLKQWLQSWASAMRTRDANAQAAFYADTLDRYLNQRNVGKGAVVRDREATIRMRKGLWTVKMEDIVIERQSESEAQVRLVKHFIDEPDQSEILESFVPTRLTTKRLNGTWKITSEQDLPALVVTPLKSNRRFGAAR